MNFYGRLCKSLLLVALISSPVYAENHHHQGNSFQVKSLTDNISMLQGKGGNIGILTGKQGVLMIDDDFQDMSPALQKTLQQFGGQEKLTYIINTHWHGDHTQGNMHFGHHAQIIAHDNVRKRLLTSQEIKLFKMKSEPYPEHALPSITYQQAMTLHINGEEVHLIHLPSGHTDGDSVVFFKKSNVVHMGDHFFNGFFPFVDVDSGGDVMGMAKNIDHILTLIDDETVLIPGHGPVSDKAELKQFRAMLEGTYLEVEAMHKQGLTLEQMQSKGLSAQWNDWTDGFLSTEVWISILYNSMMK